MNAPQIELDDEGRACWALVPSRTRPGAMYELQHYPSGWVHEDVDCRGWVDAGHCYHIDSMEAVMNELVEEERAITVSTSPLALMNDVDLHAVMSAKLVPVKEWTYSFSVKGQRVEGMAARGVQDAVRALSTQGEAIRCTDVILVKDDETDAYFKAVAGRFAISPDGKEILTDVTVRAKRQPKFIRRQDGSSIFNEFWYEIGTTKAARNAVDAMLPTALREYMKEQARIAASTQHQAPVAQPTAAQSAERRAAQQPRAQAPAAAAKPADERTETQAQILADIRRAKAEWGKDDFGLWATQIQTDFPDAFTTEGKPRFPELDADALTALAARVRADVGEVPEMAL